VARQDAPAADGLKGPGAGGSTRKALRALSSYGILIFLALLAVFFQWSTGRAQLAASGGHHGIIECFRAGTFLTAENESNVLRQTSTNTIIAVGMTLVIITGGIDLSVGAIVALSGMLAMGMMMHGLSWPPQLRYRETGAEPLIPTSLGIPAAAITAMVVGAVAGLHNSIPVTRLRVPPFIATLGMMTIARGLAYVYTDGYPIGNLPDAFTNHIQEGPLLPIVALATVASGHVLLTRTSFGRAVYAIGGNQEAARLSGVNVARTKTWVYVLSGTLCGLAGLLLAGRIGAGDPKSGTMFELNAIAAVVLGGTSLMGGVGTVLGTLLGALVIGSLEAGLVLMGVSAFWQMVIKGYVILMAVVLDQVKSRL
jgi:ribose transport system permease protein